MKRRAHIPIAVDARSINDALLVGAIREFTRALALLRTRRMDLTADEAGRATALRSSGAVMVADAWRRGLLDDVILAPESAP